MVSLRGANFHTLGMLAGQAGDLEECIAYQSSSMRDHFESNNHDSARAALCEILMATNQWRVSNFVRSHLGLAQYLLDLLVERDYIVI